MSGPLEGVKILELEAPRGDTNRTLGATRSPNMAALYLTCNRNKRSLVLDLKQPSGHAALLKLAEKTDVLIHNNRPQVMTRLALDYADIKAVNPKVIYCGTYGYGKAGPYGAQGALDDSIQASSGIAMLNEMVLGEPRYLPTVIADKTTALGVVYAVTAALYHRERTGVGQEIEVPMYESMVHFVMAEHLWGMTFEPQIGTPGYKRLMSYHRKPYKTQDGYIAILPYLDSHWEKFCRLSGRADLLADSRFTTLADRVKNIDDTYEETAKTMITRTTGEWLELFGETNVPTNLVNTLQDLKDDPHLKAVDFWQEVDHPTEGRIRMTRFPVTFSETPADVRQLPPRLGEHSVEILREAGLSQTEVDAMLADGVTVSAD
jgi:crotonobetainyl-CoA:carnitine CoA-transferase CaiB-like acyl-CoA transferase